MQNRHDYLRHADSSLVSLHVLKPASGGRPHGVSTFPMWLKRGDVRARIPAARGLSTHFATCVETHLRAASTWGFDIPDMTKRGDVSAK